MTITAQSFVSCRSQRRPQAQSLPASLWRRTAKRLAVVLLALSASSIATASDDWEITRDGEFRNEVSTWSRTIPNQQIKAFRGRVDVPHTLLEVLSVLADIERYSKWVFQCDRAAHLSNLGEDIVYLHIRGIWPVDDRDVVTRSRIIQDPDTLTVTVHSWADDSTTHPLPKKTVRMPELENLFILEPLSDGWTRVTFQTFVDPGGSIPKWLANFVATRAPLDTLRDLTDRLKRPQYKITDLEQLPFVLPGMDTMTFPKQKPRG
ncbi:MAG: hypothetical protein KBT87_12630 [Gammaproteobacteria bacterium]|nr:hypothetical protein [Gammaproteobacteria bacterium]MBQ0775514.1 hypothetical protein [Gammaproteobacteria bacterium]